MLRARESRIRCPRPSASARDSRAFQPQPHLLFGVLQLDLDGEIGERGFATEFLPQIKSGPALGRHPIHRAHQLGMLKKVQLQRQAGPQRRADGQHGFEPLAQRWTTQLRVDAPFQIANPTPNGCVGAEQPPREKRRVRHPQLFGVKLGLLAQPADWVSS